MCVVRTFWFGGLLLCLPLVAAQQAQSPAPGGYVGSNACKTCHADVWANFYKNPHYRSIASGTEAPEKTGCESCHGPAKAHLEARGGKATIRAFSEMQPARALNACLACHEKQISRAQIRRSSHTQADVACNSCHSIHRPNSTKALLAKKQTDLCYGCHSSVRAQFAMPHKHRVNEGSVQCVDCHNPHGSAAPAWRSGLRPRMTETTRDGEEACLKCHIDKRGPFAFEHAALRVDGCESCHSPHGSMNARMLKRPVVYTLCLECHNGAGSFGTAGTGIPIQTSSHNLNDPRYRNCTTCHVRIHGSNSDPRFLR